MARLTHTQSVQLHAALSVFWWVATPIAALAIPGNLAERTLVGVSFYALACSHTAAWGAARIARKQHEDADVQDVVDRFDEFNRKFLPNPDDEAPHGTRP